MGRDSDIDIELMSSQQIFPEGGEKIIKILVVGALEVGKTAFIRRWLKDTFDPQYRPTIGVDFAIKQLLPEDLGGQKLAARIQIWDIGGQEVFGNMMGVYARGAEGVIFVGDLTRTKTIGTSSDSGSASITHWNEKLSQLKGVFEDYSNIPKAVILNKADFGQNDVDIHSLASTLEMGPSHIVTASAKDGAGMQAFQQAFYPQLKNYILRKEAANLSRQPTVTGGSGLFDQPSRAPQDHDPLIGGSKSRCCSSCTII
mgnify:CR=1 FL=1